MQPKSSHGFFSIKGLVFQLENEEKAVEHCFHTNTVLPGHQRYAGKGTVNSYPETNCSCANYHTRRFSSKGELWLVEFPINLIENLKLHVDNSYPNRPPSCGIYPLHSLKEGENEVNTHFSLKVSSQSELHKRRRTGLRVRDDSSVAPNLVVAKPAGARREGTDLSEEKLTVNDSDYIYESLSYMQARQEDFQPAIDCFGIIQMEVNEAMRRTLIDWMAEVVYEYKKGLPTLFLSINYLDRLLSRQFVPKRQLQLLGTACLLLASKMEEIKPFSLQELTLASDNYCNEKQLVAMELIILQRLNFELSAPTIYEFVSFLFSNSGHSASLVNDALYMAHSLLYDVSIMHSHLPFDLAQKLHKLAILRSTDSISQNYNSERDLLEFEIEHASFQNMHNDDLVGLRRFHQTI